jgi:hypothetical protein
MVGVSAKGNRLLLFDCDDPTAGVWTVEGTRAADMTNFRLKAHAFLVTTGRSIEPRSPWKALGLLYFVGAGMTFTNMFVRRFRVSTVIFEINQFTFSGSS